MAPEIEIRPLRPADERSAFSCGNRPRPLLPALRCTEAIHAPSRADALFKERPPPAPSARGDARIAIEEVLGESAGSVPVDEARELRGAILCLVALQVEGASASVWVYDLARGILTQLAASYNHGRRFGLRMENGWCSIPRERGSQRFFGGSRMGAMRPSPCLLPPGRGLNRMPDTAPDILRHHAIRSLRRR